MSDIQAAWLWLYIMLGVLALLWLYEVVKDRSFQNGYWKGRQVGWNMHRRMMNIKRDSDEVFDYDKD